MEDGAVVERDAVLLGVRNGIGPVLGALGQADEIGDADGATSGNRVQVSLPAVVSIMAVGPAARAAAVLARQQRRASSRAPSLRRRCLRPSHRTVREISRQIEKQIRMEAPERRACPAGRVRTPAPTWVVMTAKYDSISIAFQRWGGGFDTRKHKVPRLRAAFRKRNVFTSLGMTEFR